MTQTTTFFTRWCSNHNAHADNRGGEMIFSSNGLTCRWICKTCKEARAARKANQEVRA